MAIQPTQEHSKSKFNGGKNMNEKDKINCEAVITAKQIATETQKAVITAFAEGLVQSMEIVRKAQQPETQPKEDKSIET